MLRANQKLIQIVPAPDGWRELTLTIDIDATDEHWIDESPIAAFGLVEEKDGQRYVMPIIVDDPYGAPGLDVSDGDADSNCRRLALLGPGQPTPEWLADKAGEAALERALIELRQSVAEDIARRGRTQAHQAR